MIVYLGHAKANYSSLIDGYIQAARQTDYDKLLCSFAYTDGNVIPGLKHERLPRAGGAELVYEPLRSGPPRGGAFPGLDLILSNQSPEPSDPCKST